MSAGSILLVIDDPSFRGPLLAALRERGLKPILAGSGEQADEFLAHGQPALAIVDARLPGEGGVSWIRAKRAQGFDVPIVLCAATREEALSLKHFAPELALSSLVPKTAKPEAIASHVEDLLGIGQEEPAPAAGRSLSEEVEAVRVSLVNLQKNPQSMERLKATLAVVQRLHAAAKDRGVEPARSAAKRILEVLEEAHRGRTRLDQAEFVVIEKALLRAREAVPAAGTPVPPVAPKRTSAAAHVEPTPAGVDAPPVDPDATDDLTGVLTREAFLQRAQDLIDDALLGGRPVSLCLVGIDGAPGLLAAQRLDAVLQSTGRFLSSRFRPEDLRGRWADDRFALAFPGTPASMAVSIMTRTLEAFAALTIAGVGGQIARLNVGVATYPKDGQDAEAVLEWAARRMDAARKAGGGTVRG